jgi:hypothetical protein
MFEKCWKTLYSYITYEFDDNRIEKNYKNAGLLFEREILA